MVNEIVACSLEVEGCEVGQKDSMSDTPLAWAARNGHEAVIEILLGRKDIDPDKPGEAGRTPLWWAAHNGYEGVVKLLLGRDDVNPDKPDERGQTPLWWAAYWGHEGIVEMLLGRDDVHFDTPDGGGRIPLCYAVMNGHHRVVKILLEREGASPDMIIHDAFLPLRLLCWPSRSGSSTTASNISHPQPGLSG